MSNLDNSMRGFFKGVLPRFKILLGIACVLALLFPVYWIVNLSFQPSQGILATALFPSEPSWEGYRLALSEQGLNLRTSIIVAVGSVVFSLVLATPAAYGLSIVRSRWVDVVIFAVLISQMIPSISIANALFIFYNKIGLLDSYAGLILADSTHAIPFAVLILRSFMLSIPPAIIEAARVDGASSLRTFLAIVVPISKNSIITAGVFSFLFSWSDFLFALTLTTDSRIRPITLGIYQYLGSETINWSAVMATAALSSIPAVLLLLLAQRFISSGIAGGAVK